jgi:hypothetical protein
MGVGFHDRFMIDGNRNRFLSIFFFDLHGFGGK